MPERSSVRDFLDAYRGAFEAFDVSAIADLFSYPCQVTGDAGELAVTTVATREAWIPQIERLVAAYRAIGVQSAHVLALRVIDLAPRLAQATVNWRLVGEAGGGIYDFDASYTLADLGEGIRITAIAHNETPHLAVGELGDPLERARGSVLEQVLVHFPRRAMDEPYPLAAKLEAEVEWQPVHEGFRALVGVRKRPGDRALADLAVPGRGVEAAAVIEVAGDRVVVVAVDGRDRALLDRPADLVRARAVADEVAAAVHVVDG